ncbi:MAG: hypothetical protein HYZ51_00960 [Candidatus Doudnabacteria bacterium]|nr:hypothetical protein [Candidatus Doudnabacteria bacterium]
MAVHGDGSVDFDSGNFKFMPQAEHLDQADNSVTREPGSFASKEEALEYYRNIGKNIGEKLAAQEVNVSVKASPQLEYQRAGIPREINLAESASGSLPKEEVGSSNLEADLDLDDDLEPSERLVEKSTVVANESREALLVRALEIKDNAKAIKQILSEGQFKHFLKDILGLSERKLNSLKNVNLSDFFDKLETDKKFGRKFAKLGSLIYKNTPEEVWSDEYSEKTTIRKWLLIYALKIKK